MLETQRPYPSTVITTDAPTEEIAAAASRPVRGPRSGFRADIEGLRSIAVLLVVLSHAGIHTFAGGYVGVDVFFVISGFLITSLLMRELEKTGRISIAGFYARRAVRLLPASSVVLLATLAGSWLFLSPLRSAEYAWDALASASYWINFRLALTGTDYMAATEPSPFQHFWSLAVEEQFYLVWPLLILAAVLLARLLKVRAAWTVAPALVLLSAVSFWFSLTETVRSAPWAYFGVHTRAWELGLGALVALGAGWLARMPRPLAVGMTWLGLVAVVVAALRYDESTPFPGYAAALPVVGTAAIIAGGTCAPRFGVEALLRHQPFQWIGKMSYGWYLWHWPMLMIAPSALGVEPTVPVNLALSAGALLLAAVSLKLVEDPVRHRKTLTRRPVRGISLGLALSATVAAAAVFVTTAPPPVSTGGDATDVTASVSGATDPRKTLVGLVARAEQADRIPANLTPELDRAKEVKPAVYADGCHLDYEETTSPEDCYYGDTDAKRTMVLLGDSHAAHWFPALDAIGKQDGWRVLSLTKSSCPATDTSIYVAKFKRTYTQCATWRKSAQERIRELKPDLVVVSSSVTYGPGPQDDPAQWREDWRDGWARTLAGLRKSAKQVTLLAETPYLGTSVPDCLAEHANDPTGCAPTRTAAMIKPELRNAAIEEAKRLKVRVVDPTPWLCATSCPVIIGDVLMYQDSNHFTVAASTMLAPVLRHELRLPRR